MWVSCRGWDTEGRQRLKGSDRRKAGVSAKAEGCESILSERFPLCSPRQGPLGPLGAVYLCQAHLLTLSFALGSASKAGSLRRGDADERAEQRRHPQQHEVLDDQMLPREPLYSPNWHEFQCKILLFIKD